MTVKEHLERLRQGVTVWNAWSRKHPNSIIDLRHANLSRADLSGAILSFAVLSGADFSEAHLSETHLSRAILDGAILDGADLRDADLSRADLSGAYLSRADLSRADLRAANLFEAILRATNLSGAILRATDLFGADLSGADLSGADLSRADLSRVHLSGASFSRTRTGLTHFDDIDLSHVQGLEDVEHLGPSYISVSTFSRSQGNIPDIFLKGTGLEDTFIEYVRSLTSKPIEYYTCFISYSSKDEQFARRLHNDLQQEGVRCWFAPEDMDIGDKIRHRIEESIRLYDKLLLILSEHSIASNWVAYEVERALNKEPQGRANVLYPVRVDKTIMTCTETWAHDIKSTRHIGDFEHWTDPQQYEANFKRLLRALNTKKDQLKN